MRGLWLSGALASLVGCGGAGFTASADPPGDGGTESSSLVGMAPGQEASPFDSSDAGAETGSETGPDVTRMMPDAGAELGDEPQLEATAPDAGDAHAPASVTFPNGRVCELDPDGSTCAIAVDPGTVQICQYFLEGPGYGVLPAGHCYVCTGVDGGFGCPF